MSPNKAKAKANWLVRQLLEVWPDLTTEDRKEVIAKIAPKPRQPEWLSEAMNSGNGTYKP